MHEAIDRNPFILFVNPSLGTTRYKKEDILRTYLSLGTLASALTNRGFLKRFCRCLGKKAFIFNDESAYPDFDIRVIHLSLKPDRQTVHDYLSAFLRQVGVSPLMVCMTATSAQLDEAEAVASAAEQIAPGALRIIGGPHVSVVADEYLECSEFQVACIGEGVETLWEHYRFVNKKNQSWDRLAFLYLTKTLSYVPLYTAHRIRSISLPVSFTHQAPERFNRVWHINLFADSIPPLPMG